MVNPSQYTMKAKKRAVDPNAPPRPNLLSHEKKLKESQAVIDDLHKRLRSQGEQIAQLQAKYERLQQSIGMIINQLGQRR